MQTNNRILVETKNGGVMMSTLRSLSDWITREALSFSMASTVTLNMAIERLITSLDPSIKLLGFGEALHGGEDFLILRNRLFQRLAEFHGYSAITIESSFSKGDIVNEYVNGRGSVLYETIQDTGFTHGFGRVNANRELVEWMKQYNADPAHHVKLRFYGFDTPTEMSGTDSPRQVLRLVLDYLELLDSENVQTRRERIEELIGLDSDWENPAAMMDPTKSIGLSNAATALRIELEDIITELQVHRPELIDASGNDEYLEAVHYASVARWLLNYHAEMARNSQKRISKGLGMRDAMMADNLVYIASRESDRGKVLVFAHNQHLKRTNAKWQLGPNLVQWSPAGSHLTKLFGSTVRVHRLGRGRIRGKWYWTT